VAVARATFIDEVVGRVEQQDGELKPDDRKDLRHHCATWFDTVTGSLEYNYELTWADFRPGMLARFLLGHVLEGEQPNYVVDWILIPAVKDYAGLWLTDEAWRKWDGAVFEHPVSRGS
jgi:hypothetical protein